MLTFTVPRPRLLLAAVLAAAALVAIGAVGASALSRAEYTDVGAADVHGPGIDWLTGSGVTVGCGDGRFCGGDAVTRAQVATFLHRLAGHAPGTAPSVDAATVGGRTADELRGARGPRGERGPAGTVDEATLAALTDRLDALEATVTTQDATIAALEEQLGLVEDDLADTTAALATAAGHIEDLEELLTGVERVSVHGRDTLRFEAMNVQVVSGAGATDGPPNGLGNLMVGYAELGALTPSGTSGSHYLVLGRENGYTGYGGMIGGFGNRASGPWASVVTGRVNRASGPYSVVLGGQGNEANASYAFVVGGGANEASGFGSSVTGGWHNLASGQYSSILGGFQQTVSTDSAHHP